MMGSKTRELANKLKAKHLDYKAWKDMSNRWVIACYKEK